MRHGLMGNDGGVKSITLPWRIAAAHLREEARAMARRPVVVGVTGPVGSGKSTLARNLSDCVVGTDHYLPDYSKIEYMDRDLPRWADLDGMASDLARLREGLAAEIPVWSFQTHRREGTQRVEPRDVIVVEGIHALTPEVAGQMDLRVFVDAPTDTRWRRWEALEVSGERGWGVQAAREFFESVAEPTFARFASGYRDSAHYIVVNDGSPHQD